MVGEGCGEEGKRGVVGEGKEMKEEMRRKKKLRWEEKKWTDEMKMKKIEMRYKKKKKKKRNGKWKNIGTPSYPVVILSHHRTTKNSTQISKHPNKSMFAVLRRQSACRCSAGSAGSKRQRSTPLPPLSHILRRSSLHSGLPEVVVPSEWLARKPRPRLDDEFDPVRSSTPSHRVCGRRVKC